MSISLSWAAVSGAATYKLYRAALSAGTPSAWTLLVTQAGLTYTDSTTSPGLVYLYGVSAVNAEATEGPLSNAVIAAEAGTAYAGNLFGDYLTAMQAALYGRLKGLKLVALDGKACEVYDSPVDEARYPFVYIGQQGLQAPWTTKTEAGAELELSLTIVSRAPSNKEVNALADTILRSLTTTKLDLSGYGLNVVHQNLGPSRVSKLDGLGTIRELQLRLKVEDLTTAQLHR